MTLPYASSTAGQAREREIRVKRAVVEAIRQGRPVRIDPDGTVHISPETRDTGADYDLLDMKR